jgi:hypothetical protein
MDRTPTAQRKLSDIPENEYVQGAMAERIAMVDRLSQQVRSLSRGDAHCPRVKRHIARAIPRSTRRAVRRSHPDIDAADPNG